MKNRLPFYSATIVVAKYFLFCYYAMCIGCSAAHKASVDELPYAISGLFEREVLRNYEINTAINPFYIRIDADGDEQADYAVYARSKEKHTTVVLLIKNDSVTIKTLTELDEKSKASFAYWKETNRFPAGAALQHSGGGIIVQFINGDTRWLYYHNGWQCVNPN